MTENKRKKLWEKFVVTILILFGVYIFLMASLFHAKYVNLDQTKTDQGAYLNDVKIVKKSGFRYWGDRTRMPLYLFTQAVFYQENLSNEEAFYRGKLVNIYLALLSGGVIYFAIRRYVNEFHQTMFVVISMFTVIMGRAGYYQAEVMHLVLSFLAFICMLRFFKNHSYKNALMAALFSALAYLSKASVLVMIMAFMLVLVIKVIELIMRKVMNRSEKRKREMKSILRKIIMGGAVYIISFGVLLSPYLISNKRIYGKYFFNYATSIAFWEESWVDAKPLIDNISKNVYRGETGDIKSNKGFIETLSEYRIGGSFERIRKGVDLYKRTVLSISNGHLILKKGYNIAFRYIKYYFIVMVVFSLFNLKILKKLVENIYEMLFVLGYFITYLLAVFWYGHITTGMRFILVIYLPILFGIIYVINRLITDSQFVFINKYAKELINYYQVLFLPMLFLDIYTMALIILPNQVLGG